MSNLISPTAFILAAIIVNSTGCTSYSIKYPENLKSTKIDVMLTIPEFNPPETIEIPDGLIPSAVYMTTFEKGILEAYNEVDLRLLIIDEFIRNAPKYPKYVNIIITPDSKNMNVPFDLLSEEESKGNPYLVKYHFSEVKDKIKTPYVLVFKVIKWGHNGKHVYAEIEYFAAIYDTSTGNAIWAQYDTVIASPIFRTNMSFDKEKAIKFVSLAVREAALRCMDDISGSSRQEIQSGVTIGGH